MTRLLVTGASGFLGRHLHLAAMDDASIEGVLALVRDRAEWDAMAWTHALAGVDPLVGGLEDVERWSADARVESVDVIVHLAALVDHSRANAGRVMRTNVDGTLAMVRLAARIGARMIFLSTSGTVGCFASPTAEADEGSPYCVERVKSWPYYASKIRAEQEAASLADSLGVELAILRPPVLLGPGDHRGRSTSTVRRVLDRKVPVLFDGGMHFVDVRDVASAILTVARMHRPRAVYNLPGVSLPLADYFRSIAKIAAMDFRAPMVPSGALRAASRVNARLGRFGVSILPDPVLIEMASSYWGLRSRYAAADLGFISRPAAATLRETIDWLRANPSEGIGAHH